MRQLLPPSRSTAPLTDTELAERYAFPGPDWVRANTVSTLDGAATGEDGLSGSIHTPPDTRAFAVQRSQCDAVLVGARTAVAEGYERVEENGRGVAPLLVVASRTCEVPPGVLGSRPGRGGVVLVTCAAADGAALARAREALGEENVWVLGEDTVDLAATRNRLTRAGAGRVVCEGGPSLLAAALAAGVVDEVALTLVPSMIGGPHPRVAGSPLTLGVDLEPALLLEEDGTLLGLWRVRP